MGTYVGRRSRRMSRMGPCHGVLRDLRRADALLNSRCLPVPMERDYSVHIHCTGKSVLRRTPAAPKRGCSKVRAAGCMRRDLVQFLGYLFHRAAISTYIIKLEQPLIISDEFFF
ncbi:uncharacterized protein LOC117151259 [Bombus impatiens]|uniref:Uncharacterized protein LOC117151259 n=1 Tax=Bombus impatiens TaxID=132113 RepID=A0A6P8KW29_BOMIM|nr:uncharacterized protein LOC117151259 [Bombus impatiens]